MCRRAHGTISPTQDALKLAFDGALKAVEKWDSDGPRTKWVLEHAAQACLVACGCRWTEETEAALEELENGTEDAVQQ